MEEKFFEQLRDAFDAEGKSISPNDKFRDYDEWSSLANLSLIAMLDDSYGVVIPPDEFKKISTVGELMEEVKKRR
jgi:acyl carrier protein